MTALSRDERGQALLLVVGFTLVVFSIGGVAIDGARLWILRRGLQSSVDAAAIAAAGRLDSTALYASGGTIRRLDPSAAIEEARRLIARRGLVARVDITIDGNVVRASVTSEMDTSFLSLVGVERLSVAAEAAAAPVFGEAP